MKQLKRVIGISLSIFVLFCLGYWGYMKISGNIHTVIPGQVYRSAQLSPAQLQTVIDQKHIKAIIDLAPYGDEYPEELAVANKNHVTHFDLGLNALIDPSPAQLKQLNNLIQTAPRPLLIHCAQGADRTGLASAMALAATPGYSDWNIKLQYSIIYGAIDPRSIGKTVMGSYFTYLSQQNLNSTPENFKAWLQTQN
jgi:undecaprenyl-diphosphatase